jgi:hypothetical protein
VVENDLGFFRVEIEMALEGMRELEDEGENSPNVANGYYQIFGVTASSFADAVASVEEVLVDIFTEEPEISGWLVQLQVDPWSEPAAGADGAFLQDPSLRGVHFISDRTYFLALDEEPGA